LVKCFKCNEYGHRSYEHPNFLHEDHTNQIIQVEDEESEGSSLLLKRLLLKPSKEIIEQIQRKSLFRTTCKSKGKCCKIIIDGGSTDNLVSLEMVDKLSLERFVHPTPYKVS
jgi:hypothetical protein